MTPEQMQIAGEMVGSSNKMYWTEEELSLGIAALDHVLPFMEGASYGHLVLFGLRIKREELLSYQEARKRR